MKKLFIVLFALVVLVGCSQKIYYETDCKTLAPLEVIETSLNKQMADFIPIDITINNEFVKWITNETEGNYVTGFSKRLYQKANIIFFNAIDDIELKKVQAHFESRIKTNDTIYVFKFKDIETARELCQAFECMQMNNTKEGI